MTERVTNALLLFGTVGMGFGGRPWVAFTVAGAFIIVLAIVEHVEISERYRGQPITDIVLATMLKASLALVVVFAFAWAGYGARLLMLR